jgi:hypothetical protein
LLSLLGINAPDTIITPPLSVAQVATLEGWFGSVPPTKVSVVGIWETGVFLVGSRASDAIRSRKAARQRRPERNVVVIVVVEEAAGCRADNTRCVYQLQLG